MLKVAGNLNRSSTQHTWNCLAEFVTKVSKISCNETGTQFSSGLMSLELTIKTGVQLRLGDLACHSLAIAYGDMNLILKICVKRNTSGLMMFCALKCP